MRLATYVCPSLASSTCCEVVSRGVCMVSEAFTLGETEFAPTDDEHDTGYREYRRKPLFIINFSKVDEGCHECRHGSRRQRGKKTHPQGRDNHLPHVTTRSHLRNLVIGSKGRKPTEPDIVTNDKDALWLCLSSLKRAVGKGDIKHSGNTPAEKYGQYRTCKLPPTPNAREDSE